MNIEIVSKSVKMNQDTFAPELEVVVRLPLEALQDQKALDPNFYESFGREMLSLLESK